MVEPAAATAFANHGAWCAQLSGPLGLAGRGSAAGIGRLTTAFTGSRSDIRICQQGRGGQGEGPRQDSAEARGQERALRGNSSRPTGGVASQSVSALALHGILL